MIISEKDIIRLAEKSYGQIKCIYLHWTAGRYNQLFNDYHLNIDGVGNVHQTAPDFNTTLCHTWLHNQKTVGLTLCCAYDAVPTNLGLYPPTNLQIEVLCRVCALILKELQLVPSFQTIRTHAEQAEIDGYGPSTTCERWDLWLLKNGDYPGSGGDYLRQKIKFYYQQL